MSARPDMAKGTRNVALTISTSITGVAVYEKQTPLGARWEVHAITATGAHKVIALMKDEAAATVTMNLLRVAGEHLRGAAEMIVRDREGR